jgi:NADH-quinone oxidoreductase subunit D
MAHFKMDQPKDQSKDTFSVFTTKLDEFVNWGRKNSLWPFPMGISCCAIELMAFAFSRYDVARFGAEALRFSPRQADLMICSGTLTEKMAPVLRQLYDQMCEPKWVVAMGACLVTGGMFDSYPVVQGLDQVVPVDVYVPGCPPRPETLLQALMEIQKKVAKGKMLPKDSRADYKPKIKIPHNITTVKPTREDTVILNMGPSHPATHGVLRVVLELDGETVVNATPFIGYLHRGYEKLGENKTYNQFVTYTDRLDYLAPLSNNVSFALAAERLLEIDVPKRAKYIRVICCELARISSHMMALGAYGVDLGALTIGFYTFNPREECYDIYEKLTGARFTTSYTRIGGVARDANPEFITAVKDFLKKCPKVIGDAERLLNRNRIWFDRNRNVGVISKEMALSYGLTGPNLRCTGINWDLRKDMPYLDYQDFDFNVPVGENGDAYDRFMLRILEMKESLKIIEQAINNLPEGSFHVDDPAIFIPPKEKVYTKMEELIEHFKIICDGVRIPKGEVYSGIENPKGELGFYLKSEGDSKPSRVRIKSPSFGNIQIMGELMRGNLIADCVTVIASLDPVMGECDR